MEISFVGSRSRYFSVVQLYIICHSKHSLSPWKSIHKFCAVKVFFCMCHRGALFFRVIRKPYALKFLKNLVERLNKLKDIEPTLKYGIKIFPLYFWIFMSLSRMLGKLRLVSSYFVGKIKYMVNVRNKK